MGLMDSLIYYRDYYGADPIYFKKYLDAELITKEQYDELTGVVAHEND